MQPFYINGHIHNISFSSLLKNGPNKLEFYTGL